MMMVDRFIWYVTGYGGIAGCPCWDSTNEEKRATRGNIIERIKCEKRHAFQKRALAKCRLKKKTKTPRAAGCKFHFKVAPGVEQGGHIRMRWTCVLLLLLQTLQRSECFSCTGVVPNSDKTASDPCRGQEGDACDYTCNQGFVRVGVHACQTYTAAGTTFINQSYYGGECVRLCRPTTGFPSPRPPGKSLAAASAACAVPIRSNSTDVDGACFRTDCFDSGDAALKNVARGAFEIWQQVRNATNGMLLDHFTLGLPPNSLQNSHQGTRYSTYAAWLKKVLGTRKRKGGSSLHSCCRLASTSYLAYFSRVNL